MELRKVLPLKASPLCLFDNHNLLIIHFKKLKNNGEKINYVTDFLQ